jgi:hypothetical protein
VQQDVLQAQQQQLLEQLLLDLYSHVNEPDGVYALVAAFGSPASQLQLLQHEQQWAAVLGGQDALLQAAVLQRHQQPQNGSSLHVTGEAQASQLEHCVDVDTSCHDLVFCWWHSPPAPGHDSHRQCRSKRQTVHLDARSVMLC